DIRGSYIMKRKYPYYFKDENLFFTHNKDSYSLNNKKEYNNLQSAEDLDKGDLEDKLDLLE
ncbi:MAG: hypothetical protein QW103_02275, partial [Candidatus Pacearchaeota archaeon]